MTGRTTRRQFLGVLGAVGTGSIVGNAFTGSAAAATDEVWRQAGFDAAHSGHAPDNTGPATVVGAAWTFDREGVQSPPAVANETVYLGTGDARVYAIDALNGLERWHAETAVSVAASPAVVDGVVYASDLGGTVYAFDATDGDERWRVETGDRVTAPVVLDGTVYLGGRDGSVTALSAADGSEQWRVEAGESVNGSPAVLGDAVYVGTASETVALSVADGSERWRVETGRVNRPPAVGGDTVYVGAETGVYALSPADGSERWRVETGGAVDSSPAVAEGTVYVVGGDGRVYALSAADGTVEWRAGRPGSARSSPVVVSGTVYAQGGDGRTYALDAADGTELWSTSTGDSSPAVTDGTVYVTDADGAFVTLAGQNSGLVARPALATTRTTNAVERVSLPVSNLLFDRASHVERAEEAVERGDYERGYEQMDAIERAETRGVQVTVPTALATAVVVPLAVSRVRSMLNRASETNAEIETVAARLDDHPGEETVGTYALAAARDRFSRLNPDPARELARVAGRECDLLDRVEDDRERLARYWAQRTTADESLDGVRSLVLSPDAIDRPVTVETATARLDRVEDALEDAEETVATFVSLRNRLSDLEATVAETRETLPASPDGYTTADERLDEAGALLETVEGLDTPVTPAAVEATADDVEATLDRVAGVADRFDRLGERRSALRSSVERTRGRIADYPGDPTEAESLLDEAESLLADESGLEEPISPDALAARYDDAEERIDRAETAARRAVHVAVFELWADGESLRPESVEALRSVADEDPERAIELVPRILDELVVRTRTSPGLLEVLAALARDHPAELLDAAPDVADLFVAQTRYEDTRSAALDGLGAVARARPESFDADLSAVVSFVGDDPQALAKLARTLPADLAASETLVEALCTHLCRDETPPETVEATAAVAATAPDLVEAEISGLAGVLTGLDPAAIRRTLERVDADGYAQADGDGGDAGRG